MKIHLVVSEIFLGDRQTDGLTVATNLVIPLDNFANGSEIFLIIPQV